MPTLVKYIIRVRGAAPPAAASSSAQQAIELLKALVRDGFECPVYLYNCTDTHINPECLHRFCGDCINKKSHRKCNRECPASASCTRAHIPTKRTLRKDSKFVNIVSDHFGKWLSMTFLIN